MIICICRRISDRDLARNARAGMSFDEMQLELGVATQCGQCEHHARGVVDQCSASAPIAAIQHTSHQRESVAWNFSQASA